MGPGAAGTAYIPALADSSDGEEHGFDGARRPGSREGDDGGGRDVRARIWVARRCIAPRAGVGNLEVPTDQECLVAVKKYLSFFPSSCDDAPPDLPVTDPIERREEALLDILPENPRRAYDMYKLIGAIVDHGEWLDLKPRWARSIITCLSRIGGRAVGIVANQPNHMGGILDVDSADKAARFIQICDAFNIPLVFLQDVPGFMIGSKVEHEGIIRHGAKLLHAMSAATVPKLTVVV